MAAMTNATFTLTCDSSALEAAIEKAQAMLQPVLREMYIAEGSPNGETLEGFKAWLAAREAVYIDVPTPGVAEFIASVARGPDVVERVDRGMEQFMARLDQLGKIPVECPNDCEYCHPEGLPS